MKGVEVCWASLRNISIDPPTSTHSHVTLLWEIWTLVTLHVFEFKSCVRIVRKIIQN